MSFDSNAVSARRRHDVPAGYCPQCDYQLMQPGICPECGSQVSRDQLRRDTRRTRRRRLLKRTIVAVLALTGVVGIRTAYKVNLHYRLFPDAVLIDAYPTDMNGSEELFRRMQNQSLSTEDIETLVAKSYTIKLKLPDQHPAALPLIIRLEIANKRGAIFRPSNGRAEQIVHIDRCSVGDEKHELSAEQFSIFANSNQTTATIDYRAEAPHGIGSQAVSVAGTFTVQCVSPSAGVTMANPLNSRFPFDVKGELLITDQADFEQYLTQELSQQIAQSLRLSLCTLGSNRFEFRLCTGPRPKDIPLEVTVETFERDNRLTHSSESRFLFAEQQRPGKRMMGQSLHFEEIPHEADRARVRIRFDHTCLDPDTDGRGYPVIVEWLSVPLKDIPMMTAATLKDCYTCDDRFAIPPDVVRGWQPDDDMPPGDDSTPESP